MIQLGDEEQQGIELANGTSTPAESSQSTSRNRTEERDPLMNMKSGSNMNKQPSDTAGYLQRLMLDIDERVSVKLLIRVWGPRLELVVRLMLVATFLDDSIRMAMHFGQHIEQVGQGWCLKWLEAASPKVVSVVAGTLLGMGLLAQSLGSICLLALLRPIVAIKALIGWAMVQPVLYAQLSNFEFMSETISLIGGLLMLHVHLLNQEHRLGQQSSELATSNTTSNTTTSPTPSSLAVTQLLGRLLLPAAYLYRAGLFFSSAFTLDETTSLGAYLSSLSLFVINAAVLLALLASSTLVATGLKSRAVALFLALANLGFVLVQHPFFRFVHRVEGKWEVDEDVIWMPSVALPKGVSPQDFGPWDIYDLHRYYFFLGLSTSGALLLLAQFGPGDIAMQKHEVLLPLVARARD